MISLFMSSKEVSESLAAFRGRADTVDVKNPEEGSLGINFPRIISKIREPLPSDVPSEHPSGGCSKSFRNSELGDLEGMERQR